MTWNYTFGHHLLKILLGNYQAKNYKELVEKLLDISTNMSIKVNLLHGHLNKFPDNCCDSSDEQGE